MPADITRRSAGLALFLSTPVATSRGTTRQATRRSRISNRCRHARDPRTWWSAEPQCGGWLYAGLSSHLEDRCTAVTSSDSYLTPGPRITNE